MVWGMIMAFVSLLVAMTVVMVEVMTDEGAPMASSDPAQSALDADADLERLSMKGLDLPKAA